MPISMPPTLEWFGCKQFTQLTLPQGCGTNSAYLPATIGWQVVEIWAESLSGSKRLEAMFCNRWRGVLIICMLSYFLIPCNALTPKADTGETADGSSQKQESSEVNPAVKDWFAKYDQIRRDAEMTTGDKMQAMRLNADKPNKKNAELASKMLAKYTASHSAMKELPPIPETSELHERYTEYFCRARQLFSDFVDAQAKVPYPSESLSAARKELEVFDKSNKILDKDLRTKYSISKHKHI
jgi:hypothetical protein